MSDKPNKVEGKRDDGVELETQIILRMPDEPAKALREAIQTGSNNMKDRFNIKLENDLRYGEVRFDHWLLHAKVVDLPTIVESLKTIDLKSFYKTADICQMMICKDEPDIPAPEEESPNKNKKKDPNKVDKKYLWPHGITPPCKNVRKRRFRKTLKKKCVEAPEIEKEVKRLLRSDNEAVSVKWEIITEDEELPKSDSKHSGKSKSNKSRSNENAGKEDFSESGSNSKDRNTNLRDVGVHEIFGEEVSDSDEEDNPINVLDIDDISQLSADDSRLSDSNSCNDLSQSSEKMTTEFEKNMFNSPKSRKPSGMSDTPSTSKGAYKSDRGDSDNEYSEPQMSQESVNMRISELKRELNDLKTQRMQKEQEIASIENQTLRHRLQENLDNLLSQTLDKEMELQELQNIF